MRKIIIASLMLAGLNAYAAQASVEEQAIEILKESESNNNINSNQVYAGNVVSPEVKDLVESYTSQGLRYSDFEKDSNGHYFLKNEVKTRGAKWYQHMCTVNAYRYQSCMPFRGNNCVVRSNGTCYTE